LVNILDEYILDYYDFNKRGKRDKYYVSIVFIS